MVVLPQYSYTYRIFVQSLDYSNKDNERGSGDKARAACAGNVANSTVFYQLNDDKLAPVSLSSLHHLID